MQTILYAFLGWLGGVVVNRAADNLPPPANLSLSAAPHCPWCGQPRGIDQFALISLLLRRGHCSHCLSPFPWRAPLVELAAALSFAFLWQTFGPTPQLAAASLFTLVLLAILVTDVEHRLILNFVVLPATAIALALSPWLLPLPEIWRTFVTSLAGALCGYAVVLGIYWLGGLFAAWMGRMRGRAITEVPFGMGDVKLAGLAGALVGLPHVFQMLFLTIVLGGLAAIAILLYYALVQRRYAAFAVMPYGPFFVIAAWLFMARILW